MSEQGVKACALVFEAMQLLRGQLLGSDKQDMRLGQMLEIGKEAMQEQFCVITQEEAHGQIAEHKSMARTAKRRRLARIAAAKRTQ